MEIGHRTKRAQKSDVYERQLYKPEKEYKGVAVSTRENRRDKLVKYYIFLRLTALDAHDLACIS